MPKLLVADVERLYDEIKQEISNGYDPKAGLERLKKTRDLNIFLAGYAYRSRKLNDVMTSLGIKDFCAQQCPDLPTGCCRERTFYSFGVGNPVFLALQQVEAKRKGFVASTDKKVCLYHNNSGCALEYFKVPQCLGNLCHGLTTRIETDPIGGQVFSNMMYAVQCSLDDIIPLLRRDFARVLEEMDNAITTGTVLALSGFNVLNVNLPEQRL